jgi:hypothetical protein
MTWVGSVRRRADLLAYVPLAAATTAAAVTGRPRAHLVSKMLLAPTLAGGVVATRADRSTARTATLAVALAGSAVGDWFMNRSEVAPPHSAARRQLMRVGASAFAVQQTGLLRLLLTDGVRPPREVRGGHWQCPGRPRGSRAERDRRAGSRAHRLRAASRIDGGAVPERWRRSTPTSIRGPGRRALPRVRRGHHRRRARGEISTTAGGGLRHRVVDLHRRPRPAGPRTARRATH